MASSFVTSSGPECCPNVVDPYTWVALLGGILLATYFFQQQIVLHIPGRRRRHALVPGGLELWLYCPKLVA